MTPRPLARTRRAALFACAAGLLALAGCDPRQALYFLQPFESKIRADCPTSLKGKRVVIVANITPGVGGDFVSIDQALTTELVKILRKHVRKLEIVDPEKVRTWVQNKPSWSDPAELAEAFEADVVIWMEVRQFETQNPSSPDLLRGQSKVHVVVTEMKPPTDERGRPLKDRPRMAEKVYENDCETTFPVTGHQIPEPGSSADSFKKKFLELVATEISWSFIDHAPGDDIQDTRSRQ
ncbi:MAG: hypothetical protein IRY99_09685 [Isosphaeraceae bacterium]|nr:hypothetical protein [Isosphaeraceae bacterium]